MYLVYLLPVFPQLLQPPDCVISITVNSPEISYIAYTRMLFPFYQYVVYLVVSLPIRIGPGVFIKVSVRKHRALNI